MTHRWRQVLSLTRAVAGDPSSKRRPPEIPFREVPGEYRERVNIEELVKAKDSTTGSIDSGLGSDGLDLKHYLADTEKALIQKALDESDGVVAKAAALLKLRRTTLVEKMRKYQLRSNRTRSSESGTDDV